MISFRKYTISRHSTRDPVGSPNHLVSSAQGAVLAYSLLSDKPLRGQLDLARMDSWQMIIVVIFILIISTEVAAIIFSFPHVEGKSV